MTRILLARMSRLRLGSSSLGAGFGLPFLLIVKSNTYLSPAPESGARRVESE
jgi:hypothetical protein